MYIGICCLQHNFLLPLTLPLALKYISTKVYLLKTLSLGGQVGNNFPKAEEKMYQNQCIGKNMLSQSCDGLIPIFVKTQNLPDLGLILKLCKNLNILINNGYGNGLCSLQ